MLLFVTDLTALVRLMSEVVRKEVKRQMGSLIQAICFSIHCILRQILFRTSLVTITEAVVEGPQCSVTNSTLIEPLASFDWNGILIANSVGWLSL